MTRFLAVLLSLGSHIVAADIAPVSNMRLRCESGTVGTWVVKKWQFFADLTCKVKMSSGQNEVSVVSNLFWTSSCNPCAANQATLLVPMQLSSRPGCVSLHQSPEGFCKTIALDERKPNRSWQELFSWEVKSGEGGATLSLLDIVIPYAQRLTQQPEVNEVAVRRLQDYPSTCPSTCTYMMRYNRFCDEECDNFACGLDGGECMHPATVTQEAYGKCVTTCPLSYVGDSWCDDVCNSEDCNFDGGDCKADCAEGCHKDWLGDSFCDDVCDNKACEYDFGDCPHNEEEMKKTEECPFSCPFTWLGDGLCDSECNIKACNFDGGDCDESNTQSKCSEQCTSAWIGDGECDKDCYVESCQWDGGDCAKFGEQAGDMFNCGNAECQIQWLGDFDCDDECDTAACEYDMGDCPKPIECTTWGSAGAGAGKKCVFPFKYEGVRYDECTTVETEGGSSWCSVETDKGGNTVKGQWGNCDPDCATTCMTIGTQGVGANRKCTFPFQFKGKRYDFCTTEDHTAEWCAIKVGPNGSFLAGQWAECSPACHERKAQTIGITQESSSLGIVVSVLVVVASVLLCVMLRMWWRIRKYEELGLGDGVPEAETYGKKHAQTMDA
jgi:hypothetical protein